METGLRNDRWEAVRRRHEASQRHTATVDSPKPPRDGDAWMPESDAANAPIATTLRPGALKLTRPGGV